MKSDDIDDFEIDLVNLVSSDLNNTNQYLAFEGSNGEIYAINIAKVVEVQVYKNLEMVKNGADSGLVRATAKIRDDIATIVCFDEWFGNNVLDDSEYEFVILAGFGGHTLSIMVKSVEYIISINYDDMKDNSLNNPKTNFLADIKLDGKNRLCTVFDCDKLLLDIFEDNYKSEYLFSDGIENNHLNSKKYVLFADDSRFIRKTVSELLKKMNLNTKIYENGKELLEDLKLLHPDEIGLVITDLEMPIMDGRTLIKSIKSLNQYKDINIIVHTNMSNFIIESSLFELGASDIISKINLKKLSESISRFFHG